MDLKQLIRDIPDFPKPGIIFKDITPLLQNPAAFEQCIEQLKTKIMPFDVELIVGIESRGFIFGAALAKAMGKGFIPIRKFGKLPAKTIDMEYALEYGTDKISIHADALQPGCRIALIDDVLATGGTAKAAADLIRKAGGTLSVMAFLMELTFLNGKEKIQDPIIKLLEY